MAGWTAEQVAQIASPEEVQVITRRRAGSLRRPTTICIVGDRGRVFVRSTNGRTASWFRGAIATSAGQIASGGRASDVTFAEAPAADLPAVDMASWQKYGHYASTVDHLVQDGPREATVQVRPA